MVSNEFIVRFSDFYTESARKGFIKAALQEEDFKEEDDYEVLPRNNPMAK